MNRIIVQLINIGSRAKLNVKLIDTGRYRLIVQLINIGSTAKLIMKLIDTGRYRLIYVGR